MLQWILQLVKRQKTVTVLIVSFVTVFCCAFLAPPALAQSAIEPIDTGLTTIGQPLGLPTTDFRVIIARIIQVVLGLIGTVMVILLLYGGYLWMTAGGNEEQISQAKKVLTNAAIGLAIIMSAYAITVFVIRSLTDGAQLADTAGLGGTGGVVIENFSGSGALGLVLKDHYPARSQVEVPRNSKIVITFRRPIKLDSFVSNTNNTLDPAGKPIFGDCTNIGSSMNWETDCDRVVLDDDHISITRTDTGEKIRGAAALGTGTDGKIYTVVIRPYDLLGSDKVAVPYKVRLGKAILIDDATNGNPPAFTSRTAGNDYYDWQFTCSTVLDTVPPVVRSVYPADNATEDKNTVIQIDFSKAMDPTAIQGPFGTGAGTYFALSGNTIYLKSGASSIPLGNFVLSNAYRTLEFTPSLQCGANACGQPIYCLPVCDRAGANCPARTDSYELLVKAARTFSVSSFEAIPFSGVADLSGNALDGNANAKVDAAPTGGDPFVDQNKPDNYGWNFTIRDSIDTTPPYVRQVSPGLDAPYVGVNDPLRISFSKRMRIDPLYSIDIQEKPVRTIPLCRVPSATFNEANGTTLVEIVHCAFAQGGRNYYYPVISSEVEDANFNCLYPGKGPGGATEVQKHLQQSSVCDANGNNCCPVDAQGVALCCNGAVGADKNTPQACLQNLRDASL